MAGWVYSPPVRHFCALPGKLELDKQIVGAIWQCGTCNSFHIVEMAGHANQKKLVMISPHQAEQAMKDLVA